MNGLIQNHMGEGNSVQIRATISMKWEIIRIPIGTDGFARTWDGFTVARCTSQGDAIVAARAMTQNTPRHIHEVLNRGKVVYRAG